MPEYEVKVKFYIFPYRKFKIDATNEEEARNIATHNFGILAPKVPGQETPHNPWNDSTVVKCIELDNSNYSTDGPAELLEATDSAI